MFMERLTGGITMHRPVTAPAVVLALGNGFDFWAINAAREWPKSRITAHSLLGMHKDKNEMDALLKLLNLTDRVTYVRGDPTRELRLDYPNNTFDMVRLSYCSLNLAETEWYVFLQEVNRVMKPGAVLEVIDEDLLFPGHKPPGAVAEPEGSGPGTRCYPLSELVTSDSRSTFTSSIHSVDIRSTTTSSLLASSSRDLNHSEGSFSSLHDAFDPLDHSKLTRSWREMLTSRWISASITSVLPFYLTAIFETFRALPALEILMCSCSSLKPSASKHGSHQQMLDPEPFRHLVQATVKHDPDAHVTWLPASEAPPHYVASNMSMHLGRMVAVVSACKEAIWGAYNKLYGNDPRLPYLKSRCDDDEPGKTSVHTVREEFEHHWLNWECDMRSRIDMRSAIHTSLQWDCSPPRDEADYRVRWQRNVERSETEKATSGHFASQPVQRDVVRCVRGFVAWKFGGNVAEHEGACVG